MLSAATRADLAVRGIRFAAPVQRRGGAGPTDDGHVVLGDEPAAIPVNDASPFHVENGRLWLEGRDLGVEVTAVRRPRFYDEITSDGIAMHRLARLHGTDVLATTVVQTCVRYVPDQRCRYCSIEESLVAGTTTRVKTPAQLAEVASAATRLDAVGHMVMTTGTAASADRGARYLARCVTAVKEAVPSLRIQVQCEPPADPGALPALRAAGAHSIGIHVESLDDEVRRRWLPGKASVPLAEYWAAWDLAVGLFGRNQVSTYLLVGLGEDPDALVAGARELIRRGVYPFVVPVRPGASTLAALDGLAPPSADLVADISTRISGLLRAAEMRGADQAAGCAACGACSPVGASSGSEREPGSDGAPGSARAISLGPSRRTSSSAARRAEPVAGPRGAVAS